MTVSVCESGRLVRGQVNTPTVILAGILVVGLFSLVTLSRNISTKSSSLEALHIRIDGDICKRTVEELGKQMVVRQNTKTHTFQELPRPHSKRLMVGTISLRAQRTKYFQHEKALQRNLVMNKARSSDDGTHQYCDENPMLQN